MGSVRWGAAVGLVVIVGGIGLFISPDRDGSARATPGPLSAHLSVGYDSGSALAAALRTTNAVVVRRLGRLHVAEVSTTTPQRVADRLRRARGIRFVQRTAARTSVGEPALTLASMTPRAVWEWQAHATHEDAVPASVLRAASSLTIAVIDTGADLTAPDLAAKAPQTYNTRTTTADVSDENGHGTFVASLAAGSVTNDDGIAGAGGDAQLLVVKAGNARGSFTDIDEAAGLMYAVDHGAKIINLSVGGPDDVRHRAAGNPVRRGSWRARRRGRRQRIRPRQPGRVSGCAPATRRIERRRRLRARRDRVDGERIARVVREHRFVGLARGARRQRLRRGVAGLQPDALPAQRAAGRAAAVCTATAAERRSPHRRSRVQPRSCGRRIRC